MERGKIAAAIIAVFQFECSEVRYVIAQPRRGGMEDRDHCSENGVGAGDVVTVTATSGVQILGLQGDENAYTITPFLPGF